MRQAFGGCALLVWLFAWAAVGSAQAASGTPPELASVLAGLAGRVQQYYERVGSIVCVEIVTQQELKSNLVPTGKPRVTVYELSVSRDSKGKGENEFRVERTLQSVNGKRARKNQQPECTDPRTGTPEPLGFLLAKNQPHYRFLPASARPGGSAGPAETIALDFEQTPPDRINIKWQGSCFEAEGGGLEGRIWFDPETSDVLQIDARLPKPFSIPAPSGLFGFSPPIRVESSTMILRFARVNFEHPDETVLLPESTEVVTVFRGVPSLRTSQILGNFRRFLSESTVRPAAM